MRRSTLMAAVMLPALMIGCLFSTTVRAGDRWLYPALVAVDELGNAMTRYRLELGAAFLALTLGSLALLLARVLATFARKLRGPLLRTQEEID